MTTNPRKTGNDLWTLTLRSARGGNPTEPHGHPKETKPLGKITSEEDVPTNLPNTLKKIAKRKGKQT